MKQNVWDYYIECDQVVDGVLSAEYASYLRELAPDGTYVMCGGGTGTQKSLNVVV